MASCDTCSYWDPGEQKNLGHCRRHPPQLLETVTGYGPDERRLPMIHWPQTLATDWCGEWEDVDG
jgi:hypothetical protein